MLIFNMKFYIFYSIFSSILIQDFSWYNIYQVSGTCFADKYKYKYQGTCFTDKSKCKYQGTCFTDKSKCKYKCKSKSNVK